MMRLYSLLLYIYPASFRSEYGDELLHVFAERRRLATNLFSLLALWLDVLGDTLVNAAAVHLDILRQDLRYAVRTLTRTPGFTLTAIVVTGLGIGANTAVFSVTDHVLIRPLPFAEPHRLVKVWEHPPQYARFEPSPPNYLDWRRLNTSFEEMAAYKGAALTLLDRGEPKIIQGTSVTPELFSVLRAQPFIGRTFAAADVSESNSRSVILSYDLWQTAFGGSADILERPIRSEDGTYTVVGVMPADFYFPSRTTRIWTVLDLNQPGLGYEQRDNHELQVIARLKPASGIEQAQAEMDVIADQLERQYPKENAQTDALVVPLSGEVPNQSRVMLYALFGASLCILLIACANLANLLVARAMARRKELTVRAAIGAGRERLVRQLLTESILLATLGGSLGLLIAAATLPMLTTLVPTGLPIGDATILDSRVFSFAALITFATGLVFGVFPAFRLSRGIDSDGLREGSRTGVGGRRESLRSVLVIAEVTASVVLLISSGLLIRALWKIQSVDPGFRSESVLTVQTPLPMPRYNPAARRIQFYTNLLSEIRSVPGVSSAGYISYLPMTIGGIWSVEVPGVTLRTNDGASYMACVRVVTPDFFKTMGIPFKAGRDISESDTDDAPWVVVVSESFVRRYWPNQDPLGRSFRFSMNIPYAQRDRTIVGVVGDIRFRGLERESEPQVYLAYKQTFSLGYIPRELVVKATSDATSLIPPIRRIIHETDPELPISAIRPLQDLVDATIAPRSAQLRVIGAFAALALLLAAIGLHGLLSFAVGQRMTEFGLRIALGAQSRDILIMVLREGLLLATVGTVLGLALSYFAGRSMQALLAGITPSDPLTFFVAGAIAFSMTIIGSLLPALRATRVDPTMTIRGE